MTTLEVVTVFFSPLSRSFTQVFCVSADEVDQISTRTLAVARYKHNHDWMNDVFRQAAYRMPCVCQIVKKTIYLFIYSQQNNATSNEPLFHFFKD